MRIARIVLVLAALTIAPAVLAQRPTRTQKPPLHGAHWMAITGKPLAATAGAMIFERGGNAVDAAAAMIAATCTMWDTLSWGGETQALIYNPNTKKVIGLNALGWAPTGATPEYYKAHGYPERPPEYGPLAAVTPGTPGGIMAMVAEYGTMSLKDVLAPAIQMADGYPIEAQAANLIERDKAQLKQWPYSATVMLPHRKSAMPAAKPANPNAPETNTPVAPQDRPMTGAINEAEREGPQPGEIFRQPDLAATLRKLVETEQKALAAGKNRKEAIYAAMDRFYKGDIAEEIARSAQEQGGLITVQDLATWKPRFEQPETTNYRGIDVYKLTVWTQGPAMLQALNILENFDLKSMGYNSPQYINIVYQAMSLAFADRDFYYGDPAVPPVEPVLGLLSKDYARERAKLIKQDAANPDIKPGDPYPFQRDRNPFLNYLEKWTSSAPAGSTSTAMWEDFKRAFLAGTTSVEAADEQGWVVSVTPSGGWIPAVIAGKTGIGLTTRAQSFVIRPEDGPYNVIAPHKQPRVTLTPSMALKDGKPFLCFSVQGGDTQDQNLLQMFLNIVDFGMPVQQAAEAPNINSYQMRASLLGWKTEPSRILIDERTPQDVRAQLEKMGYKITVGSRTSGPLNAILFDQKHGTMWGGSSNNGEDYGIGW